MTLRSSSPAHVEHLQHGRDALADLRLRHAAQPQAIADVAEHGHMRPKRVGLEHHRDAALLRRQFDDVAAEKPQRAGHHLLEAGDGAQQRGLAAARGAENRDEFARRNAQVDAVQHTQPAIACLEARYFDCSRNGFGHGTRYLQRTLSRVFFRRFINAR